MKDPKNLLPYCRKPASLRHLSLSILSRQRLEAFQQQPLINSALSLHPNRRRKNLWDRFLSEIDVTSYKCLSNEFIKKTDEKKTYFTLGMSRGAIGIILSHLSILQDAYDSGYK